jgi:energy-coupling factor transporter ATP-binding protein EcfA2
MISEIKIQNFKSIQDLNLKLGRVTVLIGENGSGKSNILEAIAFAGCAATDKLDDVYLAPRGIRVTEDPWMVSAFPKTEVEAKSKPGMAFAVTDGNPGFVFNFSVLPTWREDKSFLKWRVDFPQVENHAIEDALLREVLLDNTFELQIQREVEDLAMRLKNHVSTAPNHLELALPNLEQLKKQLLPVVTDIKLQVYRQKQLGYIATKLGLSDFVIYAPENTILRLPPPESALQPLGTKGEGLFRLLQSFTEEKYKTLMTELQSRLHLFGWFDEFLPPDDSATNQARLQINDRWLAPDKAVFDQRSANEGFLFVLFYFTLLMSWRTPKIFAIDNIDTALNPKLCSTLMTQIVELAKKYDKQVICTTHNPAILDGLNINDDEQRLYTVQRDADGRTTVNRVKPPKPQPGKPPMKLSAAFLAGHIGGLPDHF